MPARMHNQIGIKEREQIMSTSASQIPVRPIPAKPAPLPEVPADKPLNEAAWNAWAAKGQAEDNRSRAALLMVLKWGAVPVLILAALAYRFLL